MTNKKPMSTELESRLNSLKTSEHMSVIVMANSEDGFKSLTDYLKQQKVSFGEQNPLRTVSTHLTKDKIYEIAKLDYVSAIMEDQPIRPIR